MIPIYDDSNYHELLNQVDDEGIARMYGSVPRDWAKQPFGSSGVPFGDKYAIIDRSEWGDRLREQEKEKATLSDLIDHLKIPPYDQNGTNFCWAAGACMALTIARARANLPYIDLSFASIAAPINRYRNQGGWTANAIEYIKDHGVLPASQWPHNYYRNDNYEDKSLRAENKIFEFIDVIDQNMDREERFDAVVSAGFYGFSCAVSFNFWGHAVASLGLAKAGRDWGHMIYNSWGGGYGENGKGILAGSKRSPDNCEAIRVSSQ
tara:strand:+ start:6183 stop:6974 length:792 start_codon:yes stop_codon:yes gene_type:complete